jgi:hypothetical protein
MYLETFKVEKEFDYITNSGKKSKRKRVSTHVRLQCNNCNILFTKEAHDLNPKRRNNNYEHFCGNCGNVFSLATKSYNKKNPNKHDHLIGSKIIDSNGYVCIYVGSNYKYLNKFTSSVYGGRIREHIFLMQEKIGRPLERGEVIHHIDGDKQNNDISNLDLCTVQEHNNCHAKAEKIVFELYKRGIVGYNKENKQYYLI